MNTVGTIVLTGILVIGGLTISAMASHALWREINTFNDFDWDAVFGLFVLIGLTMAALPFICGEEKPS